MTEIIMEAYTTKHNNSSSCTRFTIRHAEHYIMSLQAHRIIPHSLSDGNVRVTYKRFSCTVYYLIRMLKFTPTYMFVLKVVITRDVLEIWKINLQNN